MRECLPILEEIGNEMMPPRRELELHRFLARMWARLGEARDPDQAIRSAARDIGSFLEARGVALASVPPGTGIRVDFSFPLDHEWPLSTLEAYFLGRRPEILPELAMAPLRRNDRTYKVLAFERDRPFDQVDRKVLTRAVGDLTKLVRRIDRERTAEVRSRIERKIMEELRPKDLFYQILHGLRGLTGYDHSSALLIVGERQDVLELAAEQISWRKGKSKRVGTRLSLPAPTLALLTRGGVFDFERRGRDWYRWDGSRDAVELAELLDYNRDTDEASHRERVVLCAPIVTREGATGVVKVASCQPGALGTYESKLLDRFLPQVSVAIQNSRRNATLQSRMLEAEKKNAMADLARGVAHDLNNALGGMLPLIQQLRADVRNRRFDPETMSRDLEEIERSLQVCRRIFGGMLDFARGVGRSGGMTHVANAVGAAMTLLSDGLTRRKIRVSIDVEEGLPPVRGSVSDLEQVFFNVLANARDAMVDGGRLEIRARRRDGKVEVTFADEGTGIPEEHLERILEPFFTTKPKGYGLGLAICRAIVWGLGGEMALRNRDAGGTQVTITLPAAAGGGAE